MDYQQFSSSVRPTPTYPSYTSTSGFNQYDNHNNNNRDQRYIDSYGRSIGNPLPAVFRTAAMASNSSMNSPRNQQFNYLPTPRNNNSGYISDTNDVRRSSISIRPKSANNQNIRSVNNTPNSQQSYYSPSPVTYNTKIIQNNDQSYYSDSEYVSSGPRYTKISRQAQTPRRPSNVVLPIRSMTSKAYDQYVPPESPKQQQQPAFDVYRYQQEQREREQREREQREHEQREREQREQEQREREQRERERQEQYQRQLYQQQQAAAAAAAAARYKPPHITLPAQDQRRKSDRK